MAKIGVIGCGAWGVTIGKIADENHHHVQIWCHNTDFEKSINEAHLLPTLPQVQLPSTLKATTNLDKLVADSDYLVFAVASNFVDIILNIQKAYKPNTPILILTKGLLENKNTFFVSDYIAQILGTNQSIAVLSGPNLALEIAQKLPAATVIASEQESVAAQFQHILSNPYFRVYRSTDLKGVVLGGILKNIIAIAAGAIDGLSLGDNAKSALMARGLQEMIRFGKIFNAKTDTFFGLSGLGDLITTCSSPQSRNFQVGFQIAKTAQFPDFTKNNTQIAEGVKSAKIVFHLAKQYDVEMPITAEIYTVLYENKSIQSAIYDLMTRTLKTE